MRTIRYDLHFATLAVAAAILWLVRNVYPPYWISSFDFFHYALMGALHATSIVISLRRRRTNHPSVPFPIYAAGFITLAAVLSAFTPFMGLWGSIVWYPFDRILRERDLGADTIFLTGSAIGASGYWLLVRVFWLKSLRRADWLRTVALCVTATLLALCALHMFDGYVRGVARLGDDAVSQMLTLPWWFAFSISLYWNETGGHTYKSTQMAQAVT
jgi:hypothetical protein